MAEDESKLLAEIKEAEGVFNKGKGSGELIFLFLIFLVKKQVWKIH